VRLQGPSSHPSIAQIDAQLIVRQAETLERHKKSRPAFFGGKRYVSFLRLALHVD
jgi:hypothetical protein